MGATVPDLSAREVRSGGCLYSPNGSAAHRGLWTYRGRKVDVGPRPVAKAGLFLVGGAFRGEPLFGAVLPGALAMGVQKLPLLLPAHFGRLPQSRGAELGERSGASTRGAPVGLRRGVQSARLSGG